jgi:hypothetical protein
LDRHAVSDLVRLRAMLEHAKLLAADQSEHGRHVALISLDGAAEYAMGLAALHRQLGVAARTGFHEKMKKLVDDLGDDWQQAVRKGVFQVHDARNQAQHDGVTPDSARMGGWTDEVDVFVESLVWAAYGVALDEVLLANAIENEELREHLGAAEITIEAGEALAGFATAYDAFCNARRLWHDQQEDAYGYMPLLSPSEGDPRHLEPGERSADYADVSVFASDLGEYHWLITTRQLVTEGMSPTIEDARRALQFAYHWILRWQQFDARYPRERWRRHFDSLEPPSLGNGPPQIAWVEVSGSHMLDHRDLHKVVVQLANLPARGRDDWGTDMQVALGHATSRAGASEATLIAGQQTVTGQLTIFAERSFEPEQLAVCLRLAVDEATRLYRARREDANHHQRDAESLAVEFGEVFARYDGFFGEIDISRQAGPSGDALRLAVRCTGGPHELREIASIVRSRGGQLAATSHGDGRLIIDAFRLDDDSRAKLDEALGAAIDHVLYRRDFDEERERDRSTLEAGLQETLGAPSEAVSAPDAHGDEGV